MFIVVYMNNKLIIFKINITSNGRKSKKINLFIINFY